jgi:hypothetical protein
MTQKGGAKFLKSLNIVRAHADKKIFDLTNDPTIILPAVQ